MAFPARDTAKSLAPFKYSQLLLTVTFTSQRDKNACGARPERLTAYGLATRRGFRSKIDVDGVIGVLVRLFVERTERETRRVEKKLDVLRQTVADQNLRTGTFAGTRSR